MKSRNLALSAMLPALLLGACAAPEGYPSLAIRESERVSGTIAAPPAPTYTPAPTSPATLEELASRAEAARAAHARFLEAAAGVRAPVSAAAGAARGTDSWAQAQVAIAGLESIRSEALIALADVDRLYLEAAVEGAEVAQLEATRDQISALVDEENRLIAELLATIGS